MGECKMKRILSLLSVFLLLAVAIPCWAFASSNNFTNTSIPSEAAKKNDSTYTLKHKIHIENFTNGVVSVVDLEGNHTM